MTLSQDSSSTKIPIFNPILHPLSPFESISYFSQTLAAFKVLMCGFQAEDNYVKGKMNHTNEVIYLSKSTEIFFGYNCVETIANLS